MFQQRSACKQSLCLLLNKEAAGWGLSDAVQLSTSYLSFLFRLIDLYRFDKEKTEDIPTMHWAEMCKYSMEFSCFIFLMR